MKDLKAFFTELKESDALKAGLAEALKNKKLPEFLKENDCDADPAELVAILRKVIAAKEDESMSMDEMDTVAGGVNYSEYLQECFGGSDDPADAWYNSYICFDDESMFDKLRKLGLF